MYLIWLLISVFFGLLIEIVAYVLIGEKIHIMAMFFNSRSSNS